MKWWKCRILILHIVFLFVCMLCSGCVTHCVHGKYMNANGIPLYYTVEGEGTPVFLVHGVAATADLNWRRPGITRALAKDHQVISFDNRGHGRSGKPHGQQYYGREMVEDVVRLMDHLNIEKAHVIGYSMGGLITLKLLTLYPDRLLSAAPCGAGWEQRDADGQRRLEAIAVALESHGDYGPLLEEIGMRKKGFGRVKVFVMNRFFRCINDEQVIADIIRSLPELEVSESDLRRNTVPVLSIAGSKDPLKRGIDKMSGVLACHEMVIIPGGTHYSTLNKRQMRSALRDFIHRHDPETP